jgi:hypothetical protein
MDPAPPSGVETSITVPFPRADSPAGSALVIARLATLVCALSVDPEVPRWFVLVAVYVRAIFPMAVAAVAGVTWGAIEPPALAAIVAALLALPPLTEDVIAGLSETFAGADPAAAAAYTGFWALLRGPPGVAYGGFVSILGFPSLGDLTPERARVLATWVKSVSIPELHAHFGVVLFLAGKTVTAANHATVLAARTRALEQKFFDGVNRPLLGGLVGLSQHAATVVSVVWIRYSNLRASAVHYLASIDSANATPAVTAALTNFWLLAYSGLTSYVIVERFLATSPWVWGIPALGADLGNYVAGVKELLKYSEAERPYVKLIFGDAFKWFRMSDVRSLRTMAINVMKRTQPTLAAYAHDDDPGSVTQWARARDEWEDISSGDDTPAP